MHRAFGPLLVVLLASSPAFGGPFDNQPKILLHVTNPTTKNACALGQIADCVDAVTSGGLYPPTGQFVYLIAARGNVPSIASFECGLTYDGHDPNGILDGNRLDVFGWFNCGTIGLHSVNPTWPEPGSGAILFWDTPEDCQTGSASVAGYFYVAAYGPDSLRVTRRPASNAVSLYDCGNIQHSLDGDDLGIAAFSPNAGTPGCNPCDGPCPDFVLPPPPPPPPPPPGASPRILVHVTGVTSKNACSYGQISACGDASTEADLSTPGSGPYYFAYLIGAPGTEGLTGIQCGITYDGNDPGGDADGDGLDVFGWTLCGTFEYPSTNWPKPGGGTIVTWSPCRTGFAVAGYFYVGAYSPDFLRVIPRPIDGAAKTARCDASEVLLGDGALGFAAFSQGAKVLGCNPCLVDCAEPTPVQETTWGGIKSQFK